MNTSTLSLALVDTDDEPPATTASPAPVLAAPADVTIDILAPGPRPVAASRATIPDAYAQQAAREYAQGLVDQPLWDRALLQARGEKVDAAGIYLRSRAIALRVATRHVEREDGPAPEAVDAELAEKRRRFARRAKWISYRRPAAAAIAAAGAAILIVAIVTMLQNGPSAGDTASAAPTLPVRALPAAPAAPKAPPPPTSDAEPADSLAVLRAKIDELRLAGNWNVLVLYAVEWTRREPENAAAWNQLRAGYMYLRQFDDALGAAETAVRLAPRNVAMWRRLGEVNGELDDPPAALAAYREAVALDPSDLASLRAIGLLETRLGHPAEAKAAFERGLAAHPGDAITMCLRNGAAQLLPTHDAYAMLQQVTSLDAQCHGRVEGTVRVR